MEEAVAVNPTIHMVLQHFGVVVAAVIGVLAAAAVVTPRALGS